MEELTKNQRVKQVRQKLNLTQSKFAKRIAISTSYLAGMELGDKKVNDRTVKLIGMEFNVDEHWLKTGEGDAMFRDDTDLRVTKAVSLFKSLTPVQQRCALDILNALADMNTFEE
ncbi:MAG: helix-turn-helix domain-containing protein [Oscillospiraceae bacterium]|jgi:transcriptional regulator with XRE-family HTH domain|nr:helix-turn-helix domain-containing protein [Oscillospiraceae bacterium]